MLTFRRATLDDAPAVAALYARAFANDFGLHPGAADASTPAGFALMVQTGHAFLLAEGEGRLAASVRLREEEGVLHFDLLASAVPGAGRALTRAVDRAAQDRGLRLVRTRVPDRGRLPDVFARWGYLPVGRARLELPAGGQASFVDAEKRVPLLTVREQRRDDAPAIAALTGEDTWFLAQAPRPGWFVLADGDRVAGVIAVRDAGRGRARLTPPTLADGYQGRTLEPWMLERASLYAATNGALFAEVPATPALRALERELEDRRWFREGEAYVRRLEPPSH